ncbi:MAG: hypothetical protein COA79_21395 [Planctomycetota bacterium]|nr:MAG: hypothetical protein COA79_21395 [Planctomycetota bacterium]
MIIYSIAKNTFKETARNKIFLVILGFGAVGILLTKIVAFISPETEQKMIIDFGLATIYFFCTIIAIFNGASLIHKDLEKRTIYTVITKPIGRHHFLIGKFFGLIASISVSIILFTIIFVLYCHFINIEINITFYWAVFFIFIQICIISSVSIMFSLISSPLLSATFTIAFYMSGYWVEGLLDLISLIKFDFFKQLMTYVYYLLPKLFYLDIKWEASSGADISYEKLLYMFLHGLFYIIFFLLISNLLLRRKSL